jgi:hypothetical protein
MAKSKKIDGVIEAVRYKNGQIAVVRAYERRGPTYTDIVHLDRKTLLLRLQEGKQFFTGQREILKASTFNLGKQVKVINQIVTTRAVSVQDDIEAPVF